MLNILPSEQYININPTRCILDIQPTYTHPLEWRIILMDDDAPVRSLMPPPSCCLICGPASSKFVQHFSGSLKSDQFVCIKCTSTDDGLLARLVLRNARPHERNYRQTSRQPPGPHLAPHSWPSSRMLYTFIPHSSPSRSQLLYSWRVLLDICRAHKGIHPLACGIQRKLQ